MDDMIAVGNVIRKLRISKNLSQEVLSGFADIARSHLSDIEAGQTRPSLDTYFKICFALDISPGDLMRMAEKECMSNISISK